MGVFKRGGIWYYSLTYRGYRERKAVGSSRQMAEDVMAKRRLEIREGLFFDNRIPKKILLENLVTEYLEYSRVHKRSFIRDKCSTKNLLKFFSCMNIADIKEYNIEQYIQWRKKQVTKRETRQISNSTVNKELYCLSSMFELAKQNNYLKDNPVRNIKKLKEENKRIEFLSKEEINNLINACDGYLKSIVILAIHTGMRKREILSIKWDDIDIEKGIIQIPNSKSGKSRVMYMSEAVKEMFRKIPRRLHCDYVFYNRNGEPFYNIRKSFANALKRAGIDRKIVFHSLRHTFCSHCVMSGVDLITLKEMLGHSTTEMVERYAHLSDHHRIEAISRLENALNDRGEDKRVKKVDQFNLF